MFLTEKSILLLLFLFQIRDGSATFYERWVTVSNQTHQPIGCEGAGIFDVELGKCDR